MHNWTYAKKYCYENTDVIVSPVLIVMVLVIHGATWDIRLLQDNIILSQKSGYVLLHII